MTDTPPAPLQEPEGYILLAFATRQESDRTASTLEDAGVSASEITVFRGPIAADSVETESRWFADTHEVLRRFHDALADGSSVVAVKGSESVTPERVMEAIGEIKPLLAFHFGPIVTKSL